MMAIINWAVDRARMIIFLVVLSVTAGGIAYFSLPKEGAPDIDVPVLFVSVPFPGISAVDSESLLVKPLESELDELDNLKSMSATAAEGYAGVLLEFDFDWDKEKTIADVRDKVSQAAAEFPSGADRYTINEINISEFPIIVLAISGEVPERVLARVAKEFETAIEAMPAILSTETVGYRDDVLEVIIDPLKLEAYDLTAAELIRTVSSNNQLIAAGEIETPDGSFGVKIPSTFDDASDVFNLPVLVKGDSVITVGDIADVRLAYEDPTGTARFNGERAVVIQIIKKKGFNQIRTAEAVRAVVEETVKSWPEDLRDSIDYDFGLDQSQVINSMVRQLEGSVLTAVLMVMIVVVASLGMRSALLVGFAIPSSFLLAFAAMGVAGIAISNIVMFGLILAVGMLVDGAIVVVEYADMQIRRGARPMTAYARAAKRMAWPITSSTATTLCAFLPMLFWPGVPGQFMGNLPKTLIFVLLASLLVALVFLPVVGGASARLARFEHRISRKMRDGLHWTIRGFLVAVSLVVLFAGALMILRGVIAGVVPFLMAIALLGLAVRSLRGQRRVASPSAGHRRSWFGALIKVIVGNPVMPIVILLLTGGFVFGVVTTFMSNNHGVEFFADTEPENGLVHVRARGNLSLNEKDALVQAVEREILATDGVKAAFAFAGAAALNTDFGGGSAPLDSIGQIQFELDSWQIRGVNTGVGIFEAIRQRLATVPGVLVDVVVQERGPEDSKPVSIRISGDNWNELLSAADTLATKFAATDGLIAVEDTRPLPGIDWKIDVDVEHAGRFGADVASVGWLIQMVTRGLVIGTMRLPDSDDEIDILLRMPEEDRLLSSIDTLRVRTNAGLIPLSNFVTREPVHRLGSINRVDGVRTFEIRANVEQGVNPNAKIGQLTEWITAEANLPSGVRWEWTGDQDDQNESQAFLGQAFIGALGLMFVILLAQFNSLYNAVLVLLAVVLSTTGVLLGMLILQQPFSIIMTGVGIVALAGIVVNNNIVLIDTFSQYSRHMPVLKAIVRTAEARLRPVILTTATTVAGLTPLMLGISIDFVNGGYTIDAPAALWWKQLAAAIVFGLGTATFLTLVLTPSLLAIRYWAGEIWRRSGRSIGALFAGSGSSIMRDIRLRRDMRALAGPVEIVWPEPVSEDVVDIEDTNEDETDDAGFADHDLAPATPLHPPLRRVV